jgi:hypothetical protein
VLAINEPQEKARRQGCQTQKWAAIMSAKQGCVGSDAGSEGAFRTLTKEVGGVNWWQWDWGTSASGRRRKRVLRGYGEGQQVMGTGTLQGMNGVREVVTLAPQAAKPSWEPCSESHYR